MVCEFDIVNDCAENVVDGLVTARFCSSTTRSADGR